MAETTDRLTAALADRYKIEREIGRGGMATVYLAEDLKHHRQVAVKVLRPDLAATLGSDRFLREIEVAAGLMHPHILPLHDSGEADGFLFYVMPYVTGESLRSRLEREHELPVSDAVRILRDVTDALASAHRQGVVHRDIKPDNVLLSEGHALVTDFGVAKAVSEATGRQQITTAGVALGTPTYMAPEQASADPNIDQRVDIYAVGVMAYELLTGQPPFTGPTAQAVLAAHVTQAPEPVTKSRPTVPPALETVIARCLEKKPADRWQSAEELLPYLESLTTSAGVTPTDTRPLSAVVTVPRRRRVVTTAAVSATILVAIAVGVFLRGGGTPAVSLSADRVLVVPLANETGVPELDGVGAVIEDQLVSGLQQTGLAEILGSQTALVQAELSNSSREFIASPAGARDLARAVGAGVLYRGRYLAVGDSLQVEVSIIDLAEVSEPARIPVVMIGRAPTADELTTLRERAMGALAVIHDPRVGLRYIPGFLAPTYTAYRHYNTGAEQYGQASFESAAVSFLAALAADSTFLWAGARATNAFMNTGGGDVVADSVIASLRSRPTPLGEYEAAYLSRLAAQLRNDWIHAARHAETMARLAPRSPFARYVAARSLIPSPVNRLRTAVEGMEALDLSLAEIQPHTAGVRSDLGFALHLLERHDRELQVVRELQAAPGSSSVGQVNARELYALVGLGRVADVAGGLEELLATGDLADQSLAMGVVDELEWHDHTEAAAAARETVVDALRRRPPDDGGWLMLQAGLLDEAEAAFEGMIATGALDGLDRNNALGLLAAARGDRVATEAFLASLDTLRVEDRPQVAWVPVVIRALLGDHDEAIRLLRAALEAGRNMPTHGYWGFMSLRHDPAFQELVRPRD